MSIARIALGVVAAAAFAVPVEAQIWSKVPQGRTSPSGDVVLRRAEQVHDGVRCELIEVNRNGRRQVERLCDYNRNGVFGDRDDRRVEAERRDRGDGVYAGNRGGQNRGQARAAEVRARNEARKRDQAYEKRQRDILKERQKREQEMLKERQKRERERARRGW
ncbi:MAG: hypothetical protein H0X64_04455 [Gemmatimonadaceae bacterium]|nr:hypothetical protein [Gemmatimonadaceae bacterium]